MADVFISPIVQVIAKKVMDAAIQEIKSVWGVEEELENLSNTLSTIQAVLEDAEEKQVTSKATRIWLQELKDTAYDADDVLDEFVIQALRLKVEGRIEANKDKKVRKLCFPCFGSNSILFRHEMAYQIKEIWERLDQIAEKRDNLHLREGDVGKRHEIRRLPQSGSLTVESNVFGRDDDKEEIIRMLLASDDSASSKDVHVIPIVGMGGLGKTTLAQVVYNDKRVEEHFQIQAYVCVSDEFDVRKVTREIIESVTKRTCDLNGMDPIQGNLKELITGKRFLIVFDDVWNENHSDWQRLRAPLNFGAKGSRILVTTRSLTVSRIMGTGPAYHLKCLPEKDCWLLFCRQAFALGISDIPPNVEEIGKEIIRKCKGLPLAVETLGGLLCSNTNENKWNGILKSEIWELSEAKNNIFPILKFSYDHLPASLKQCFAFCSIFPKDYEFDKDNLVQVWIAEGFIEPEGRKSLKDVGSEYFDSLMCMSFFQCSPHNRSRFKRHKKSMFKMHDMMHDLAEFISGDQCFRIETGMDEVSLKNVRHLSFIDQQNSSEWAPVVLHESKRLRTFLHVVSPFKEKFNLVPHDFFLKFRCLRVLTLHIYGSELPDDSFSNLKHLRYLDLSHSWIKNLPESVSTLYNLQTLNLNYCLVLGALPNDIRNLKRLQHLGLNHSVCPPPGIGELKSLQTLHEFVVGKESECGIRVLKNLNNLRGKLCISKLGNVRSKDESKEANLKAKENLEMLKLKWSCDSGNSSPDTRVQEEVLESLQPNTRLKKLKIWDYCGKTFPSWMMMEKYFCLFSLTILHLIACSNCKLLPPLGQLPFLRVLKIETMPELRHIEDELFGGSDRVKNGFPFLEELHVANMPNLKKWCGAVEGDMPCLIELNISNCPKLREFRLLSPLQELKLNYCSVMLLSSMHQPNTLCTLKSLEISNCFELVYWPKEVKLENLVSLEYFRICDCSNLQSLGSMEEKLPITLKSFKIHEYSCHSLLSMPIQGLQNLHYLQKLCLTTQLPSLPEEALPSSLCSLSFFNCHNLRSLPNGMKDLTCLRKLVIDDCPQLLSLPEDGLPATLQVLDITKCPQLKELCRRGGQFWPKISHIPNVRTEFQPFIR